MSLEVMFLAPSSPVLVELTGTRTAHAMNAIGTKILSLHNRNIKHQDHVLLS